MRKMETIKNNTHETHTQAIRSRVWQDSLL